MVAHFFVIAFRTLPKMFFNILNALNAVILLIIGKNFFTSDKRIYETIAMLVGIMLIWTFMPARGDVFLWLTGSCNYSWSIAFLMAFIYPFADFYLNGKKKRSWPGAAGFVVLSLCAGAYTENGSPASIIMAAVFYILAYSKHKENDPTLILGMIGAVLGFLFLLSAPAELQTRAGDFSIGTIVENIRNIVTNARKYILPLFCVYGGLLAVSMGRIRKEKTVVSVVLAVGGVVGLGAYSVASHFAVRHMCFVIFFLVLASQILIVELLEINQHRLIAAGSGVLFVLFCFTFIVSVIDIGALWMNSKVRDEEVRQQLEAGVSVAYITPYYFTEEYRGVHKQDIMENPNDSPNVRLATYYGFEKVYPKYD